MVPSPRSSRSTSASSNPSVLRFEGFEARRRVGGGVGGEQAAPRRALGAAHPPPQLVELGDAEALGVAHHHHAWPRERPRPPRRRWWPRAPRSRPGRKLVHDALFVRRLHLAVQQAEARARPSTSLPTGPAPPWPNGPGCARTLPPAGTPHRRGAPPPPRRARASRRPLRRARCGPSRGDRRAPGGQLVELGDVEVTEDDHRRGAGDGRGRHDEQVGVSPFTFRRVRGPWPAARRVAPPRSGAARR